METLYEINFDSLSLKGCYRSTQRLVDLYSRFEISKTDAHSVAKYKDEHGEIHFFDSVYYTDLASKIAELIKKELRKGTKAEEICVIAPQWFMLFDLSGKLRLLLPDISFDAPDISPIKYNPMNPLFLIAKLLFMPAGKNVKLRKRIAIEFISIIRDDFRIIQQKNYVEEMRHVNFFMFFALGQKRTCIYLVNVGELQRVARNILQQTSYP